MVRTAIRGEYEVYGEMEFDVFRRVFRWPRPPLSKNSAQKYATGSGLTDQRRDRGAYRGSRHYPSPSTCPPPLRYKSHLQKPSHLHTDVYEILNKIEITLIVWTRLASTSKRDTEKKLGHRKNYIILLISKI